MVFPPITDALAHQYPSLALVQLSLATACLLHTPSPISHPYMTVSVSIPTSDTLPCIWKVSNYLESNENLLNMGSYLDKFLLRILEGPLYIPYWTSPILPPPLDPSTLIQVSDYWIYPINLVTPIPILLP